MLNSQAQIVMAQFACPKVLIGETFVMMFTGPVKVPLAKLVGIKIAHPTTDKERKRLRHMRSTRKKTVASKPINVTSSCSLVVRIGPTQANMPFPIGGGACFSSAILSFGAYTTEL